MCGADPDPEALRAGLAAGAITDAAGSLEEAVRGATAVFLAAPVGDLPGLARRALAASGERLPGQRRRLGQDRA